MQGTDPQGSSTQAPDPLKRLSCRTSSVQGAETQACTPRALVVEGGRWHTGTSRTRQAGDSRSESA